MAIKIEFKRQCVYPLQATALSTLLLTVYYVYSRPIHQRRRPYPRYPALLYPPTADWTISAPPSLPNLSLHSRPPPSPPKTTPVLPHLTNKSPPQPAKNPSSAHTPSNPKSQIPNPKSQIPNPKSQSQTYPNTKAPRINTPRPRHGAQIRTADALAPSLHHCHVV